MQPGPGKFTIGRDANCDFVITDESVSRVHAERNFLDGGWLFLADRNSRNGTRVTRQGQTRQLQQEYVLENDQVQFGQFAVAVSAILEALRRKHPNAFPPAQVRHAAQAAPSGASSAPRLVRCACGFIKPETQRCPECGV